MKAFTFLCTLMALVALPFTRAEAQEGGGESEICHISPLVELSPFTTNCDETGLPDAATSTYTNSVTVGVYELPGFCPSVYLAIYDCNLGFDNGLLSVDPVNFDPDDFVGSDPDRECCSRPHDYLKTLDVELDLSAYCVDNGIFISTIDLCYRLVTYNAKGDLVDYINSGYVTQACINRLFQVPCQVDIGIDYEPHDDPQETFQFCCQLEGSGLTNGGGSGSSRSAAVSHATESFNSWASNPFEEELAVFVQSGATPLTLRLLSVEGKLIWEERLARDTDEQFILPTAHLRSGMYLLSLRAGSTTEVHKLLKL
ncbi:MAG: T9SS type A sorting domain-containing protein [Bacteroidota bacterium]